MEYIDGISKSDLNHMERIDNEIMDKSLYYYNKFDFDKFTDQDVLLALSKENLSIQDFAAFLSPVAEKYLEQMAQKAKCETMKHFGNSVTLFTPLYISNYCVNNCVYCGFNCKNKINRGKLELDEIEKEYKSISETGLEEILILTGESRYHSNLEYIGDAVELAKKYFKVIGIEIYPLNSDEYSFLHKKGADFVSIYQETYNKNAYKKFHLSGPKRDFEYRFNSQERALIGNMRGVSLGALLGLDDYRNDALIGGVHAKLLQQKYPQAEISFSVPRLRPYKNKEQNKYKVVYEKQLLQIMCAYRIFLPFAGITISTRERKEFRDNVIGIIATKISAGVKTGVGGHENDSKGDEQFEISDQRSVREIRDMLKQKNMQEVFSDYIRL